MPADPRRMCPARRRARTLLEQTPTRAADEAGHARQQVHANTSRTAPTPGTTSASNYRDASSVGEPPSNLDLTRSGGHRVKSTTGARLGYWHCWPTGLPDWGCLPAWGTARVLAGSTQGLPAGMAVGDRLAGLLPLASHAVLQPARVSATSLRDGAEHRRALLAAYQHYQRLLAVPGPDDLRDEQLASLLRPLVVLAPSSPTPCSMPTLDRPRWCRPAPRVGPHRRSPASWRTVLP